MLSCKRPLPVQKIRIYRPADRQTRKDHILSDLINWVTNSNILCVTRIKLMGKNINTTHKIKLLKNSPFASLLLCSCSTTFPVWYFVEDSTDQESQKFLYVWSWDLDLFCFVLEHPSGIVATLWQLRLSQQWSLYSLVLHYPESEKQMFMKIVIGNSLLKFQMYQRNEHCRMLWQNQVYHTCAVTFSCGAYYVI